MRRQTGAERAHGEAALWAARASAIVLAAQAPGGPILGCRAYVSGPERSRVAEKLAASLRS